MYESQLLVMDPWQSMSPDWKRRGVNPKRAPTLRDFVKQPRITDGRHARDGH